jgi:hypothetical protein
LQSKGRVSVADIEVVRVPQKIPIMFLSYVMIKIANLSNKWTTREKKSQPLVVPSFPDPLLYSNYKQRKLNIN